MNILQFYPDTYNNRKGSMVSFAFRLLIAKLPSYLGSFKVTLDRLTDMLLVSTEIKEYYGAEGNIEAERFWSKREKIVLYALMNCALAVSIYKMDSINHFVSSNRIFSILFFLLSTDKRF